jgi:epoxyqueuosine reductase
MPVEELKEHIGQLLRAMETNRMHGPGMEGAPVWDPPLMGFARGDDALFRFFREDIGSFYFLPEEAFALKHTEPAAGPLTVMSLAFPHAEETLAAQRDSVRLPSARWSFSRQYWPDFAADMSARLSEWLSARGIRSVDPERLPEWRWQESDAYGFASRWSQRHTAYAAGLGTFGLCDGLITEKGKAVRFLSLVLEADIAPTPRAYQPRHEWCLHYRDGGCGVCMARCPANAVSPAGHDKGRCNAYCKAVEREVRPEPGRGAGCGLCQAGVPCENRRP